MFLQTTHSKEETIPQDHIVDKILKTDMLLKVTNDLWFCSGCFNADSIPHIRRSLTEVQQ